MTFKHGADKKCGEVYENESESLYLCICNDTSL